MAIPASASRSRPTASRRSRGPAPGTCVRREPAPRELEGRAWRHCRGRAVTRLALFDLDHTLLTGDSDVLWCEFLIAEGLLDRATFEPRNRAMAERYASGI